MVQSAEAVHVGEGPVDRLPVDVDIEVSPAVTGGDAGMVPYARLPGGIVSVRLGVLPEVAEWFPLSPVLHPLLIPESTAGELLLAVRGDVAVERCGLPVRYYALGVPRLPVVGELKGFEPETN